MQGTRWKDSQTKQIYKALPGSEALMAYLEEQLDQQQLAVESVDIPNPERGYGSMIYKYKGRSTLLTSAPRKKDIYIHVVLAFGKITASQLIDRKLQVGNGSGKGQDVKLYSKSEIDELIKLIQEAMGKLPSAGFDQESDNEHEWDLQTCLKQYLADEDRQRQYAILDRTRAEFLKNFSELELLRTGKVTVGDFKKRLDAKAKQKVEGMNIWGFSGFSGQMFFNQLYNQAEYVGALTDLTKAFLQAIEVPSDEEEQLEEWTKFSLNDFVGRMDDIRNKAIARGMAPQKCANTKFSTFFISFFWGLQNIHAHPIYFKASKDGLQMLGYWAEADEQLTSGERYTRFVHQLNSLNQEIEQIDGRRWDAQELEHFLYWMQVPVAEDEEDEGTQVVGARLPQTYTLTESISEVIQANGYSISQVSNLSEWEPEHGEPIIGAVIWKYDCQRRASIHSFVFVWGNGPGHFHAKVFEEDEQAHSRLLVEIRENDSASFLKKFEQQLQSATVPTYTLSDAQQETYLDQNLLQEWLELLTDRKQIILYGPPGTGKTYVAQRLAKVLAQQEHRIRLVQFHPSYTYEEFMEGLRPELIETPGEPSKLNVVVKSGIFAELCKEAAKPENREKPYVLIIDEINRANTAKVFGELLFALEYRGSSIELPYSRKRLTVPGNVYLIGTMNMTDRSLAQLDLALRRRFQFIPFTASDTEHVLERFLALHAPDMQGITSLLRDVNTAIGSRDHVLGHSYFMNSEISMEILQRVWKYQIIPYLEEYFVMEPERVADFDLDRLLDSGDYFS